MLLKLGAGDLPASDEAAGEAATRPTVATMVVASAASLILVLRPMVVLLPVWCLCGADPEPRMKHGASAGKFGSPDRP